MPTRILEGVETEVDEFGLPIRTGPIVRLGPLNVQQELKDIIEQMAEDEYRSISSVCRMLIEYGLKARLERLTR